MRLSIHDKKLLSRNFTVSNPETLENVIKSVPSDYETSLVEFEYDENPGPNANRDKIWCAHCKKYNHFKGYVMNAEGVRYTIGHVCGSEIYGLEFNTIKRKFTQQKDRQQLVSQLRSLHENLPELTNEISILCDSTSFAQMDVIQRELQNNFKELTQKLRLAATNPPHILNKTILVRDFQAEERRSDKNERIQEEINLLKATVTLSQFKRMKASGNVPKLESETEHIFKRVEQPIFMLKGVTLFTEKSATLKQRLGIVKSGLSELSAILRDVESKAFSNKAIRVLLKKQDALKSEMHLIAECLEAPRHFLTNHQFSEIVKWAHQNKELADTYSFTKGYLIRSNQVDGNVSFAIKNRYSVPPLQKVLELFDGLRRPKIKSVA